MRSEDILAQIDDTLDDWTVSGDAMRSRPGLPSPPVARMHVPMDARQFLIRRLIDEHGLTRMTARHAVMAAEEGRDSEHAELVRAEAARVVREMTGRIRIAIQPMAEAAVAALRQLRQALDQLKQAAPPQPLGRRHDRPAWQSPYGPPQRRR
ncbi:hypothetical protein AB0D47_20095 [Streptomyces sp. NPDC048376]|uniref:hypothetical protein n=1 Tax=Streptomyces sp. NPDC048376 TaxID=3154926 RepID=UPI00341DF78C